MIENATTTIQIDENNKEFNFASEFVKNTNRLVYITGKAGTGKTTFLKYIKEQVKKKTVILAPTGIAAINAGGQTIHSFFQIKPSLYVPNDKRLRTHIPFDDEDQTSVYSSFHLKKTRIDLIKKMELLIIDEVSMVRCDLMDVIDSLLRTFRGNPMIPFGGVQVILIGDTFQLPPIANYSDWEILSKHYKSPFFFSSKVLLENTPVYIEFKKIYRQTEKDYIDLLNRIRINQVTNDDLINLNKKYDPNADAKADENYIILSTHNKIVNEFNCRKLAEIQQPLYEFKAEIIDMFPENMYPTEVNLQLKKGAQVMFIKNDKRKAYCNGTIGKICEIGYDKITIELEDASQINVEKEKWDNITYEWDSKSKKIIERVLGSFKQYPLRLAWAITVHKSQGLTFDKVIADLSAAFDNGQVYVALSRCTTYSGLILKSKITQSAIKTDYRALEFAKTEIPDTLIIEELNSDKADNYYKNARLALKEANIEEAYSNLMEAIKYRNDINTDTFKRLLLLYTQRYVKSEKQTKPKETKPKSKMQLSKEKNENANKPWTEEEDKELKRLFLEKTPIKELSVIFKRNLGAVYSRLTKLNLIFHG